MEAARPRGRMTAFVITSVVCAASSLVLLLVIAMFALYLARNQFSGATPALQTPDADLPITAASPLNAENVLGEVSVVSGQQAQDMLDYLGWEEEAELSGELMPDSFRQRLAQGGPFTDQELQLVHGIEEELRRREAFEARVREESLEETIYHILYEPDFYDIALFQEPGTFIHDPGKAIRHAFSQQGRMAKIMEAARNGTPEERKTLGASIVRALHDYISSTPVHYDRENPEQRSIASMMGAHYVALALPILDSGTDYFNTVTYLHALHQEGVQTSIVNDPAGYVPSEPGLFLAYAQAEYLRRIVADPTANLPDITAAQLEVAGEYQNFGSSYFREEVLTDFQGQAVIFELATRFWEDHNPMMEAVQ